jgi:hypothetical protein
LTERVAFNEFHRQEADSFGFFDRINGDDVRMIERCDRLRLALEPLQTNRILGPFLLAGLLMQLFASTGYLQQRTPLPFPPFLFG